MKNCNIFLFFAQIIAAFLTIVPIIYVLEPNQEKIIVDPSYDGDVVLSSHYHDVGVSWKLDSKFHQNR